MTGTEIEIFFFTDARSFKRSTHVCRSKEKKGEEEGEKEGRSEPYLIVIVCMMDDVLPTKRNSGI